MATIQGNLTALLDAATELVPPVRSGQSARTDQDNAGAPFVTSEYTVGSEYGPYDPLTGTYQPAVSFAPSWVYGLMLEPSWAAENQSSRASNSQSAPRFFASFGTAQKANEVELTPGKVLRFPRGARRVFIRSNQTPQQGLRNIRVTWLVDRFASLETAGATGLNTIRTWLGDGKVDQFSVNNSLGGFTIPIDGYTNFSLYIQNGANNPFTYELLFLGDVIETGTVPAGGLRLISYGPGVGNLSGNMVGAGCVLPFTGLEMSCGFTVPSTGQVLYAWRAY